MSENAESPERLRPKQKTLRELYLLSGNQCAHGFCTNPILNTEGTLYGDVAHIRGALPASARFDPEMTNEERRSAANLLLLCKLHHADVDNPDLVGKYTVDAVSAMKLKHEAKYQTAIATLTQRIGDSTVEVTPIYPASLGAFGYTPEDEEFPVVLAEVAAFADRLAMVPPRARALLSLAIIHGSFRTIHRRNEDITISKDLLEEVALPREHVEGLIRVLEGHGLVVASTDDNGYTVFTLVGADPIEWDLFAELKTVANGDRSVIESAVYDLDFRVFE